MNRFLIACIAAAGLATTDAATASAQTDPACVVIAKDKYCSAWNAQNDLTAQREYTHSGETVQNWTRLVTVIQYKAFDTVAQAVNGYSDAVKQSGGTDQTLDWTTPAKSAHAQEIATHLVLKAPDGTHPEYVATYFFTDPGKPVYAIVYSQRMPLPGNKTPSAAEFASWIADMQAMFPK